MTTRQSNRFQHTAARRRLGAVNHQPLHRQKFQHTAARRRLDGPPCGFGNYQRVSTHSRPKAAGFGAGEAYRSSLVSTHSRPKAAGHSITVEALPDDVSTHSRPKAAGFWRWQTIPAHHLFQHTAARRRLGALAAASRSASFSFNTQPPEGGWAP